MGRNKKEVNEIDKFFEYNGQKNSTTCRIDNCNKSFSCYVIGNLKRHIMTSHKMLAAELHYSKRPVDNEDTAFPVTPKNKIKLEVSTSKGEFLYNFH